MAAKKKEKLADYVDVYLPESDVPVRVHKEMYDDPEEWKDAVRRAQSKVDEAVDEGVPDPSKSKDYKADELEAADNVVEETAEKPSVTAAVSPTRELTDEEVAREEPGFDATQFNMDGSRKTAEEQKAFRAADTAVSATSPDEPESAPSETTPEDADAVASKTALSPESEAALGSDDSIANFRKTGVISEKEANLLSQANPKARAEFLMERMSARENAPPLGKPVEAKKAAGIDLMDLPLLGGVASPNQALGAMKGLAGVAGGSMPEALPPTGVPPVTNPAAPAVPTGAPGQGGAMSVSTRTRTPGAVPPQPSDGVLQAMADADALRGGAARMAADAEAQKADIQRQALINQKSLQEQAFKDQQHISEQRAAAEAAYSKSLSDGQAAMNSLMAERRQLMNQQVDPDRYWNKAGAGRKVAATLAGALFGWAGQGMDYLQHLRGLVNDDIKLQQDELRRKGDTMDALVGDQKNIIALAKQKGMTDLEAVEAAKAARYEELTQQMQMLMTDAGVKNVNPALANTLAGLAQERATALENAGKFRQQKSLQDSQTAQGWAKIRQDEREMVLKARTAQLKAENSGRKPVNATLAKQLMNTRSALATLRRMKELAMNGGFFDRANRRVKEVLSDDEHAKQSQYDQLKIRLARDVAGSSLQKPEQQAILPTVADRSGYYDPVPNIDEAIRTAEAHLTAQTETARSAAEGDIEGIEQDGRRPDSSDALPGEQEVE